MLEAVDVVLRRPSRRWRPDSVRKVGVDPFRRGIGLVDDDGGESEDCHHDGSGEREVHDRHGEAAREPHPPEPPDERVQQQGDERGDDEEEQDVTRSRPPPSTRAARGPGARRAGSSAGSRSWAAVRPSTAILLAAPAARPPAWDWADASDGALALDPHELWVDVAQRSRIPLSQSPSELTRTRLKAVERPATVPAMPSRSHRQRQGARARARHARSARRARSLALSAILLVLVVGVLATSGWGWQSARAPVKAPASASGVGDLKPLPTGLPQPIVVAQVPGTTPLPLKLPIAAERASRRSATTPPPACRSPRTATAANEGMLTHLWHRVFGGNTRGLRYYQLNGGSGPDTAELDVGAAAGTDVYSPIDGTVTGITPVILNGKQYGVRARHPRPAGAGASLVTVSQPRSSTRRCTSARALTASVSRIGQVISLSGVEQQLLAKYTNDDGNHAVITARSQTQ